MTMSGWVSLPSRLAIRQQARHTSGGWDCSKRFYSCAPFSPACLGICPVVSSSCGDATSYLFERLETQDAPNSQAKGCMDCSGGTHWMYHTETQQHF